MKRLLFWTNDAPRRAKGDANTDAYPAGFRPRHCIGATIGGCLGHEHPGEAPAPVFAGLDVPVQAS